MVLWNIWWNTVNQIMCLSVCSRWLLGLRQLQTHPYWHQLEQTKWSVGSSRKRGVPTTYPPKCVDRVTEFQAVFSLAFWFQIPKGGLFLWTSLRTPFLKKSVNVLLDPKQSIRFTLSQKIIPTRFFSSTLNFNLFQNYIQ